MAKALRTAACGKQEARVRLATSRAYLEVATTVLAEQSRDEFLNVSAGLAVLAGIAASMPSVVRDFAAATGATTIEGRPICSRQPYPTEPSSRHHLLAYST